MFRSVPIVSVFNKGQIEGDYLVFRLLLEYNSMYMKALQFITLQKVISVQAENLASETET